MTSMPLTVLGACHHDCPDTCSWEVGVVDGIATTLRGNPDHPFTRGSLCPKVNRYLDRVYHPDRLLTPLRRVGPKGNGEFTTISWDEALTAIAARMRPLMDAGTADRILQFSFAGTQGAIQMGIALNRLFDRIGASDIRRDLCGTTAREGAASVIGVPFGVDPESLRHSRTLILWGTNTRYTNRHLWPIVEEARANGATIIVVDPVRTETARAADVHIQPRPGSDVALVLGIVNVLDRDGLLDTDWLEGHTRGWADLRESAAEWTPERAAAATGVPAERIEWLAHRCATEQPTGIRSLIGAEHRENGREILRAVTMLTAVLGSWRWIGGGLARSTSGWPHVALAMPHRTLRRMVNMASLGEELSSGTTEVLVVHNCNPATILPDQNGVIAGLERDDLFTVVIEQFMTDTARYADIVLPTTTQIEQLDLVPAWGHLYLSLNMPAIEPRGDCLPNSEIARRLAAVLGIDDPLLQASDEQMIRELLASGHPFLDGISYETLAERGWARLSVPVASRPHVDDIPGLPPAHMILGALEHRPGSETVGGGSALEERYPLALLSRKQHRKYLNSHYGGFAPHAPAGPEPAVQMHPDDVVARGLRDGDAVRVHNDRGCLDAVVSITDDLQPGLVAMAFGAWNDGPDGRGVNALTNPAVREDGRGSAYFYDTLVQVSPAGTA